MTGASSPLMAEARRRLGSHEDNFTERKLEGVKGEDLRRTLVAFANSLPEGERAFLYIGVADDGTLVGVRDPDEVQKRINQAASACYPDISFQCLVLSESSAHVVAVAVAASSNRPHFTGASFVRQGSVTVKASERVFEELIASRTSPFRELQKALGSVVTVCSWTDLGSGKLARAEFGARLGSLNWYVHAASLSELEPSHITFDVLATRERRSVPLSKVTVFRDTVRHRLALAIEGGP